MTLIRSHGGQCPQFAKDPAAIVVYNGTSTRECPFVTNGCCSTLTMVAMQPTTCSSSSGRTRTMWYVPSG